MEMYMVHLKLFQYPKAITVHLSEWQMRIPQLNSNSNNKAYSTNFDTHALETIEINLGGASNAAAEILLMDKYRMFFVHAYSADGKTIGEIVTKSIYGDNVTPATNNTIISIHVGSWTSGTAIISYTQGRPSFSIKQ